MSSAVATVTGHIGPGDSMTSQVFPNCANINFNIAAGTITIVWVPNGKATQIITHIEYSDIATVTYTISAGVATVTIST